MFSFYLHSFSKYAEYGDDWVRILKDIKEYPLFIFNIYINAYTPQHVKEKVHSQQNNNNGNNYNNNTISPLHCSSLISHACVHAKSLQSSLTLCDPVDCSPPGCSVHGVLQARILEWAAMPSSRRSSRPRDQT